MKFKVLGCFGGNAPGLGLTSFLVDDSVCLDAGWVTDALTLRQQEHVRDVFISHAHLDHTLGIPFLLGDNVRPRIHGLKQTLDAVREHLLDGHIWPDLSDLVEWHEVAPGKTVRLDPWEVEVGPANHTVPCVSYLFRAKDYALAIVGDTRLDETVARWVADRSPDACAIEAAYPDEVAAMAMPYRPPSAWAA